MSGTDAPDRTAYPSRLNRLLARYLGGELSPAMALMHLLIEAGSVAQAAKFLADAEARTCTDRDGDAATQRLRQLGQLLHDNRQGAGQLVDMMRRGIDHGQPAASPDAGIASWQALFDRLVRQQPEMSVALYSLGNPEILRGATAEIVARMREWGLIAADRSLLEIGCGIGRFPAALAGEVKAVVGIDISAGMIEAARHRCAGLSNLRLLQCSGRDLSPFGDAAFDLVFAVDTFPYLLQSGPTLAERHVHEAARVLKPRGDLLILNFSYRDDLRADRQDVIRLAAAAGFTIIRNGTREFTLWDGLTFQMRRTG